MQSIFINPSEVLKPAFFTRYHHADGYHYQRIEDSIESTSFDKDSSAVRIELFDNRISPVLVGVLER